MAKNFLPFVFVPSILVILLGFSVSDALDAEFGRIITYDNFDHFKVSVCAVRSNIVFRLTYGYFYLPF